MQLGAHTFGFVWQSDAQAAFEQIAGAGFGFVQLMASPPHFDPWVSEPARTAQLRATLDRTGMTLLAADLASSDVNLASPSLDVVAFSVDSYRRLTARAAELGARWICVGSGRRHALLDHANQRLMETFRPAFATIMREAERQGVGVILENHPQGLLSDAPTIERFLCNEGYDGVPLIYDVANAFAIGEDPAEGLRVLQGRIEILHLSDSPVGQWRHDPIGSGAIAFDAIAQAAEDIGFDGTVVLEILSDDPLRDLVRGIAQLEQGGWLLSSAKAIRASC